MIGSAAHRGTTRREQEYPVSRVQLALNVDDLDAAIAFYSTLFQAEPAKRRPGYANFSLEEPALKLVLIENTGAGGTLNHLGVEVSSPQEVVAETRRLSAAGLETRVQDGSTCCYALQDKVWVDQPGAGTWEIYTVLADAGAQFEGKTLAEVGALPIEAIDPTEITDPTEVSEGTATCCGTSTTTDGAACCAS
jgi:catechol 2,3-dioxygenase-like lactoylglutathione lyase family enzyme